MREMTTMDPLYRDHILFLRRPRHWAGEGTLPITAAACRAALRFIDAVDAIMPEFSLPRPAPSVHGAVSLYWKQGEKHLVIHVSSGDLNALAVHQEGPGPVVTDQVMGFDEAVAILRGFLGNDHA